MAWSLQCAGLSAGLPLFACLGSFMVTKVTTVCSVSVGFLRLAQNAALLTEAEPHSARPRWRGVQMARAVGAGLEVKCPSLITRCGKNGWSQRKH